MGLFDGIFNKKAKNEPSKTVDKKEEAYSKSLFETNKRALLMTLEKDLDVAQLIEERGGLTTFSSAQIEAWINEVEGIQTQFELETFKTKKSNMEEAKRQREFELEVPRRTVLRKLEDELATAKQIEERGGLTIFLSSQLESWIKEVKQITDIDTLKAFENNKKLLEEQRNNNYQEVDLPKGKIIEELKARLERAQRQQSKGIDSLFSVEQLEKWLNEVSSVTTKEELDNFTASKNAIEKELEKQEKEFNRPKRILLDDLHRDLESTKSYEKRGGKASLSSLVIEKWIKEVEAITTTKELQKFIETYKQNMQAAKEVYKKIEMPKNEIIRGLQQELKVSKRIEGTGGIPIFTSSQLEDWIVEVSEFTTIEQISNFNNKIRKMKDERRKYDKEVTIPKNMLMQRLEEELKIASEAEELGGIYSFGSAKFEEWLEKLRNITTKEELDSFKNILSSEKQEKQKKEQVDLERNLLLSKIGLDLEIAKSLRESHPYFEWEFNRLLSLYGKIKNAETSKALTEVNKDVIEFKKNQLGSSSFKEERLQKFNVNNENLKELSIRLMEMKLVKGTMIEFEASGLAEELENEDKKTI